MERHELKQSILARVDKIERRVVFIKTTLFGATLLGSLSLIVFGVNAVIADASHSGFFAFSSLLFSDFSSIFANFSDYVLSMIESFPVFSSAILFAGIFFAIWSAARFINELAIMKKRKLFVFS